MITLFLYAALSIGFSFLCSILEAVLLSVTPTYIRSEVKKGTRTGKLLQEYKEDIDRPLSAILTLNTIAHTVGAILVGSTAGEMYGTAEVSFLGMSLTYEALIAGGMTLLILFASEIIPKTLGANNWKSLSPFTVNTIRIILILLFPLVWLSQLLTKMMKKDKEKAVLTRADILDMTELASSEGNLEEGESNIIQNILTFEQKTVRDIMTPRSVTFMVPADTTIEAYFAVDQSRVHSRVPVFEGDKDSVVGLVLKDDLLHAQAEDKHAERVDSHMREIQSVSDGMTLPEYMKQSVKDKQHLHIVNDEFGHVLGVVSMEDLIETLLGTEIVDESDEVVDLREHAREKWSDKNKD